MVHLTDVKLGFVSMKELTKEFPNALKACEDEYNRHYPIKGDSWRRMPISDLYAFLASAITQLQGLATWQRQFSDQLVDVVNLALMLFERREMEVCKC
jgi:fructosamine-3-kinase